MNSDNTFDLDAAFEEIPLLDVGERGRLRVRMRNTGEDSPDDVRVDVCADSGVLLVSADRWLTGDVAGEAIAFVRPPLLHDEESELVVDAYALRAGESRITIRGECGGTVQEFALRCVCEARAVFEPCANRFTLSAAQAAAGEEVSGSIVLTNSGTAAAAVEPSIDGLDAVRLEPPVLELAPGARAVVAVRGRLPDGIAPDAAHAVRASLLSGAAEVDLGVVDVRVRSRPQMAWQLEPAADDRIEWRLHLCNTAAAGAASLTFALHVNGNEGVANAGLRLANVAPGESATIVFTVEASESALGSETVAPRSSRRDPLDSATLRQLGILTGLMRHLWAIAVLCADTNGDRASTQQLGTVRQTLRSAFDRLAIKLRIPRYTIAPDDVLDRPARDALCAIGAAESADLAAMLQGASALIAGTRGDHPALAAYRSALAARLRAFRDDDGVISALTVADRDLDERLDAFLGCEQVRVSA